MKGFRLLALIALLLPSVSMAGSTQAPYQIKKMFVWGEGAASHIMVWLHNQSEALEAECPGGYVYAPTSAERDHVWDTLLFAYQTKTKVQIYYDPERDWPSMAIKDCRLLMVELEDSVPL